MKHPAVYILASAKNGTIYTGVTANLIQRIWQHKNHIAASFASKHACTNLVWFEQHETMTAAIQREKQLKSGSRAAKVKLIMSTNPNWSDLYPTLL